MSIAVVNPNLTFWIAGSPAPPYPFPPNVIYYGFADIQKRKTLLSLASVLVQPTVYQEPFGFNVLESWMSGTPVVTSKSGAYKENVTEKVGVLVDINADPSVWTEAIKQAQKLSPKDCREYAEQLSNENRAYCQYLDFFEKIKSGDF
jgi:glycosyltransferase involved in cell wall biosynthesis